MDGQQRRWCVKFTRLSLSLSLPGFSEILRDSLGFSDDSSEFPFNLNKRNPVTASELFIRFGRYSTSFPDDSFHGILGHSSGILLSGPLVSISFFTPPSSSSSSSSYFLFLWNDAATLLVHPAPSSFLKDSSPSPLRFFGILPITRRLSGVV